MSARRSRTERELQLLIALFARAEAEIGRLIAEGTSSRDSEGSRVLSSRRQKRAQVAAVLSRLMQDAGFAGEPEDLDEDLDEDDARAPAWRLVREAYREGTDTATRGMERNGIPNIRTGFTQTHQDAAEVLYENLRDRLADAVGFVGRRADDVFRRVALEETMQKLIQGRTRERTSTAIAEQLRNRGVRAFRDSLGREMDLGKYAEMVARTTTREATTTGTLNRLAESGVALVKVIVRPGACKECLRHRGKVYSIAGDHPEYPRLEEVPPFHPNCTCDIVGHVEGLLGAGEALPGSKARGRGGGSSGGGRGGGDGGAGAGGPREDPDELVRDLISNPERRPTREEIRGIGRRVGGADFNPGFTDVEPSLSGEEFRGRALRPREPSITAHLAKRHQDGQWKDTDEDQYHEDLRRAAADPEAQVGVFASGLDNNVVFFAPNRVPRERLGDESEDRVLVFYSANSGRIMSGYQGSEKPELPRGGRWLN